MKTIFAMLLLYLALLPLSISAQVEPFVITRCDVKVLIKADGSFDVTEDMVVNFSEQRRGIIRSIPYSYTLGNEVFDPDNAERILNGLNTYSVLIDCVKVDTYEYTTYDENGYFNIRIGSADKYIIGEHNYKIRYRVHGAINRFKDHHEFSWNIVGHEWNNYIENVTFSIAFEKPLNLRNNDVVISTGVRGAFEKNYRAAIGSSGISGNLTKTLNPYEGATVAIRFPESYFPEPFKINKLECTYRINEIGGIEAHERIDLNFNGLQRGLQRIMSLNPPLIRGFYEAHEPGFERSYIEQMKAYNNSQYDISYGPTYKLSMTDDDSLLITGHRAFPLTYNLWGAIKPVGTHSVLTLNVVDNEWYTDIPNPSFSISLPKAIEPGKLSWRLYAGDYFIDNELIDFENDEGVLKFRLKRTLKRGERLGIAMMFPPGYFPVIAPPGALIDATNYYVKDFTTTVQLEADGKIRFEQIKNCSFKNGFASYQSPTSMLQYRYYKNKKSFEIPFAYDFSPLPGYALLDNKFLPYISDIETNGDVDYDYGDYENYTWDSEPQDKNYRFAYSEFGLLVPDDENYTFIKMIDLNTTEPVLTGTIRFVFPQKIDTLGVKFRLLSAWGEEIPGLNPVVSDSALTIHYKYGEPLPFYLKVTFPKSSITLNKTLQTRLYYQHNKALVKAVIFILILVLLWFIYGRDKKLTIVTQYYPPEGVTAAEAGLLWDGKIHKRDLIAMIYEWAGRGYLKIIQKDKGEYEFEKLKDLPDTAKNFEKTMFKRLFSNGNKTSLSSLRNSFYHTMDAAGRELTAYSQLHKMFLPGSQGFATTFKVMGYTILGIGIIIVLSNLHRHYYHTGIAWTACGLASILIARIMPKMGHFGSQLFAKLLGFREFMVTVEMDRLKTLVDENPAYFEQTIAYAIVMGMGEKWAEKFEALISEPPKSYEGYSSTKFNTVEFTRRITNSMYTFNTVMTSKPAPPKSTYSSSSSGSSSYSRSTSSWSSSSSSSRSSYSGGSSFRSGGGSSGSGFGGGGGRSW